MLLRDRIENRLSPGAPAGPDERPVVRLPGALRTAEESARLSLLARLSASPRFSLGARAGVAGQGFRLDHRQRAVVKALVSRHGARGGGGALMAHVAYLGRKDAGLDGERPSFFNDAADGLNASRSVSGWGSDRHHFRLIISPEHGDRLADLPGYVREVMGRVGEDLGEPRLTWIATCHFDTDQPHAHVLVRGKRSDGRDLVMARSYVSYGLRARAQEVAQERLGDLTRSQAERRVWRETQANRFTGLDRRLLAAADAEGRVPDGVGRPGAWAALSRGRLRHLERIGLAEPARGGYRLALDLEAQLRRAQLRLDVIRTLNQRRLEGARDIRLQLDTPVAGVVVRSGYHDEIGARGFVIVADGAGVEHYGSLAGGSAPKVGSQVRLEPQRDGLVSLAYLQRGEDLSL